VSGCFFSEHSVVAAESKRKSAEQQLKMDHFRSRPTDKNCQPVNEKLTDGEPNHSQKLVSSNRYPDERTQPRQFVRNDQRQPKFRKPTDSYRTEEFWTCGKLGHRQRNCPTYVNDSSTSDKRQFTDRDTDESNRNRNVGQQMDNVYLRMRLCGRNVTCLINSGCQSSIVPYDLINCKRTLRMEPMKRRFFVANETPIDVIGQVGLPLRLDNQLVETVAFVSRDVSELMLGSDWLRQHNCVWDFGANRIWVNGQPAVPFSKRGRGHCRRVYVQEDVVLPPKQQT